jgi:hypothetical protein
MIRRLALVAATTLAAACGSSHHNQTCDQTGCPSGQYCEPIQNSAPGCFAPVLLRGSVSDPSTSPATLLNGARVLALDANRAPVSTVATTANSGGSDGQYELKVRATRDASGKPVQAFVTLRADDQGYQTFPSGIRPALPIDLSTAVSNGTNWVVSGTLTAIQLLKAANAATATAWAHGALTGGPSGSGVLVVAVPTGGGAAVTGIADGSGNYVIYNLVPGTTYDVTGYIKGANYTPITTAALVAGDNALSAINVAAGTGATIAGNLIFNNGASTNIQVTLVVDSTYVPSLDRGDSVPGLTVSGAAGTYTFTGVPDGTYRVLAAFGLDGDVRDISSGGNTASPQVTVSAGAVVGTPPGFKIIPAVALATIDGQAVSATPVAVTTATPVFTWTRGSVDALSKTYRVEVFDAYGTTMMTQDQAVGSGTNTATYNGTALTRGMTYQLRISAITDTIPVPTTGYNVDSYTEDLAGVFTY